jgi:hypothetical protein
MGESMSMAEQTDNALEPRNKKPKPPYAWIGGIPFRTKGDVRKYYSGVLNSYEDGYTLDGHDHVFISALLKRHRSYMEKVGEGIARFFITKHKTYGTKKVEFERVDGSIDDFSINYCLDAITDEQYSRINYLCAARTTVLPDIRAFRNASQMICAITGVKHPREDLHVDHAPPKVFSTIAAEFLETTGKKPADFEYTDDKAGLSVFSDQTVAIAFRLFHERNATLRMIYKPLNIGGGTWSK